MKKFFVLLCFLFCASNVFAFVNFWSNDAKEITFVEEIQYNLFGNSKNDGIAFATCASLDMKEFLADAAIRGTGDKIDMTFRAIYWPSITSSKTENVANFGVGGTYHLYVYPEQFTENDFKLGFYYKIRFAKDFTFLFDFNYFAKLTVFYFDLPKLLNQTLNIDLMFNWDINPALKVYTGVFANTYFDYPLSYEPTLLFGVENYFTDKFMLGAKLSMDWVDWISAVANIHTVTLSFMAGYKL